MCNSIHFMIAIIILWISAVILVTKSTASWKPEFRIRNHSGCGRLMNWVKNYSCLAWLHFISFQQCAYLTLKDLGKKIFTCRVSLQRLPTPLLITRKEQLWSSHLKCGLGKFRGKWADSVSSIQIHQLTKKKYTLGVSQHVALSKCTKKRLCVFLHLPTATLVSGPALHFRVSENPKNCQQGE